MNWNLPISSDLTDPSIQIITSFFKLNGMEWDFNIFTDF